MHHHNTPACKGMYRRNLTLTAAFYDSDGQLQHSVIAGPPLATSSLSTSALVLASSTNTLSASVASSTATTNLFPEEGIYLVYRNRAVQLGSEPCEHRRCNIARVCKCDASSYDSHHHHHHHNSSHNHAQQTDQYHLHHHHIKHCPSQECVATWLHLYEAADQIRARRLCFLAEPKSLKLGDLFGAMAFHFEADIEEYNHHNSHAQGYPHPPLGMDMGETPPTLRSRFKLRDLVGGERKKKCPPGLVEFVCDTWKLFLRRGGHDFRSVTTAFADLEDEDEEEESETDIGECLAFGYGGLRMEEEENRKKMKNKRRHHKETSTSRHHNVDADSMDLDDTSDWDDTDVPINLDPAGEVFICNTIAAAIAAYPLRHEIPSCGGARQGYEQHIQDGDDDDDDDDDDDENVQTFDLIEDLIKEEFPKLKSQDTKACVPQPLSKLGDNAAGNGNGDSMKDEQHTMPLPSTPSQRTARLSPLVRTSPVTQARVRRPSHHIDRINISGSKKINSPGGKHMHLHLPPPPSASSPLSPLLHYHRINKTKKRSRRDSIASAASNVSQQSNNSHISTSSRPAPIIIPPKGMVIGRSLLSHCINADTNNNTAATSGKTTSSMNHLHEQRDDSYSVQYGVDLAAAAMSTSPSRQVKEQTKPSPKLHTQQLRKHHQRQHQQAQPRNSPHHHKQEENTRHKVVGAGGGGGADRRQRRRWLKWGRPEINMSNDKTTNTESVHHGRAGLVG
ncbi:hypothetical protein F5Y16DRAFT_419490 [Xylariaceae sp. FL0255]|nr:hypothetical protein F5Y16DRAFT_419490 [Xylariaceae sp. FL0255]